VSVLSVVKPALNEKGGNTYIYQRVLATHARLRDVGLDDLELLHSNLAKFSLTKPPSPNTFKSDLSICQFKSLSRFVVINTI